jgi:photosystem II stability/assembly factor-like uncharacterized protein
MGTSGGLTPDNIGVEYAGVVYGIAESPREKGVIWAGTNDGLVWITTDGGANWTNTTANGLPDRVVTDIVVHSQRAHEAWAAVSGFGSGHVFHTDNYGATWEDISGYLPDTPVHAIAIDERRAPATVFVGTDAGVFVSFDRGAHWARTAGGLPNATVTDLMMDRASNTLLAATYGRGVWAAEVQTTHQTVQQQDAQKAKLTWIDYAEALSTSSPSGVPGS